MASLFNGINDYLSGGSLDKGLDAFQQAANIVGGTEVPDLSTLIPQLQKQVQQGTMTAAQAQAAIQQATAMNNVATDPQYKQSQDATLARLQQLATQGGLSDIDKAQLLDIQNQIASKNKAQRDATLAQFAQKGQGGQGAEMQAQLLAEQGNANAGATAGATVAANAQQRALQALQNTGQLSTQLQTNDFEQQAAKAKAQDAINAFNAQTKQQAGLINAANEQEANKTNFTTANTIAGTNTGIENQQRQMPAQAAQANFTNTLNRNTATGNALNKQGTALLDQGNKSAATNAGYVAAAAPAVASAVSTYGPGIWDTVSGWFSDERMKEDIQPAANDIEAMMEKLVGKRFKYRDDTAGADGGKTHIGPMAQDAERAGLTVEDTPEGKKIVDDADMKMKILAGLGNLHQRIAQLEGK